MHARHGWVAEALLPVAVLILSKIVAFKFASVSAHIVGTLANTMIIISRWAGRTRRARRTRWWWRWAGFRARGTRWGWSRLVMADRLQLLNQDHANGLANLISLVMLTVSVGLVEG